MFRLKHPEIDQTKVVIEIGVESFVTRRLGIVAKHIVYADLPETVKDALQRRRQFDEDANKASEIQATKAAQQETLEANVAAYTDALQMVLRNLGGDDAMELEADVALRLDTSTPDHFRVSNKGKFYGPDITPDQAKDVSAIVAQAKEAQDQTTILEWEVEIAEARARNNYESATRMYELAASLLRQHLSAQEHEVMSARATINDDGTDCIFQVAFSIDEILGEYPISNLPDELREKIAAPPVVIDIGIALEETGDNGNDVDPNRLEDAIEASNVAAEVDAETPAEEIPVTQ